MLLLYTHGCADCCGSRYSHMRSYRAGCYDAPAAGAQDAYVVLKMLWDHSNYHADAQEGYLHRY